MDEFDEATNKTTQVEAPVAPLHSDYENFLNSQIDSLILQEREKRTDSLEKADELSLAINFCKEHLTNYQQEEVSGIGSEEMTNRQKLRRVVMARLVELKLEVEQLKECRSVGKELEGMRKIKGHEFVLQSTSGRNPYCEVCLTTIWRLAQGWRRCKICGLRIHDKCLLGIRRRCVSVMLGQPDFSLILSLDTESTLPQQDWKCAECRSPIGFDEGGDAEPRLCHYVNRYYCARCHWNDEWVIPARLVRNWDDEPRAVCRASKQLLSFVQNKPLIDLWAKNPDLFKRARKMRILQYLSRYQHFVETDSLYSLEDLSQLAGGNLLQDIETIVRIFRTHITEECEICKGNAFICELCDTNEVGYNRRHGIRKLPAIKVIYPFSQGVSICKQCEAVFHCRCFDLVSRRCTRCERRKSRRISIAAMSRDESEEGRVQSDDDRSNIQGE